MFSVLKEKNEWATQLQREVCIDHLWLQRWWQRVF
jgi:hypothetical protein